MADEKELWKARAQAKGWEGAGMIPILNTAKGSFYVLGVSADDRQAEYFGGKVEDEDAAPINTACREFKEETGLTVTPDQITNPGHRINGGYTGMPAYVYLHTIDEIQFNAMKSEDDTFSTFILVKQITKRQTVVDAGAGGTYKLRNFNYKHVIPKLVEYLPDF